MIGASETRPPVIPEKSDLFEAHDFLSGPRRPRSVIIGRCVWYFDLARLFRALLRTRNDLVMENMALRQQLSVYGQPKVEPRLKTEDRVFWVLFSMGYRSF